ncbi:hypothetical protein BH20ACT22_BH20ACT22_06720 [soil metagenome]
MRHVAPARFNHVVGSPLVFAIMAALDIVILWSALVASSNYDHLEHDRMHRTGNFNLNFGGIRLEPRDRPKAV